MEEMSEDDIMNLTIEDFRDLTPQEKQQDNFRRMFQILGLIYKNQIEIKNMLVCIEYLRLMCLKTNVGDCPLR